METQGQKLARYKRAISEVRDTVQFREHHAAARSEAYQEWTKLLADITGQTPDSVAAEGRGYNSTQEFADAVTVYKADADELFTVFMLLFG